MHTLIKTHAGARGGNRLTLPLIGCAMIPFTSAGHHVEELQP